MFETNKTPPTKNSLPTSQVAVRGNNDARSPGIMEASYSSKMRSTIHFILLYIVTYVEHIVITF